MSPARVHRAAERGVTLLELVVVVGAICVLAAVALDRVLPLIGRAQRAAFLQVRAQLQSALLLEAAERLTRGEPDGLRALDGANPMTLLAAPPGNYLGSLAEPNDAEVPKAAWYFDERRRRLVYRVGRHTRFDPLGGPGDRIELRVAFVYADQDGKQGYDPAYDRFDGVRLEPAHRYSWPD